VILALLLQVAPHITLAVLGTAIGIEAFSHLFNNSDIILLGLFAALAFAALSIFKRSSLWRLTLLFNFTILLGGILALLSPGLRGFTWLLDLLWAVFILVMAAALSSYVRTISQRIRQLSWLLAWVYLLGWGALAIGQASEAQRFGWAGFGMGVFAIVALAWFDHVKGRLEEQAGSPLAFELYLLGFNLALAERIMRTGFG
jgi:hypothetical protein